MIFNCGIMEEGAIIQILSLLGVLEENCSKIPMKKKKKKKKKEKRKEPKNQKTMKKKKKKKKKKKNLHREEPLFEIL